MNTNKWDQYFITMSYLVSMKSKDPSTRVGAVIVGPYNEVRSSGYNGLPRGIDDDMGRYYDKQYKYFASNHAEENAILNCARVGVSTNQCRIYTQWIPCAYCAKSIVQSGINSVIYHKEFPGNQKGLQNNWEDSITISLNLLKEARIQVRHYSGSLINTRGLYGGEAFELNFENYK